MRENGEPMPNHEHQDDIFIDASGNETRRQPWIIDDDAHLSTSHSGGICIHRGGELTIDKAGRHSGSLSLRPGASAVIRGAHSGSLHVAPEAMVVVEGQQSGSVHVEHGGVVRVLANGRLAGSLHVAGRIENSGQRGGTVSERGGEIIDLPGSTVKQPRFKDGTAVYEW